MRAGTPGFPGSLEQVELQGLLDILDSPDRGLAVIPGSLVLAIAGFPGSVVDLGSRGSLGIQVIVGFQGTRGSVVIVGRVGTQVFLGLVGAQVRFPGIADFPGKAGTRDSLGLVAGLGTQGIQGKQAQLELQEPADFLVIVLLPDILVTRQLVQVNQDTPGTQGFRGNQVIRVIQP